MGAYIGLTPPADASTAITASLSAAGTLLSTPTAGYQSISVQLTGTWVGSVVFQASNDNTNWVNVQGYAFNTTESAIDTAVDNDIYIFPVIGFYFRAVVTTKTLVGWNAQTGASTSTDISFSGTVSATAYLRTQGLAGLGEASLTQAMDQTTGTPINVGFAGFNGPGQQNAANSFPVAMANEQVLDKHFFGKAYTQTSTYFGYNMLLTPEQAAIDPGAPLDCLQYRSIYFQFNSGGTAAASNGVNATFIPEASNDLINWVALAVFDMRSGNNAGINETTSINPVNYGGSGFFGGNLTMRFFRLRCSAFTTTVFIQFSTTLRMTPFAYRTESMVNIAQQGAAGLATGVTSFNSATQSVSTTGGQLSNTVNPLIIGATDRSIVRQEMVGAPINPAVTAYNFNGPWVRQMNVDVAGGVTVSGPVPWLAEEKTTPVNVRLERTTSGQDSVQDLLQQMLVEFKAFNYYVRELPQAIAAMNQLPNPQSASNPASMQDDSENFADDPTTYRYQKGH